MARPRNFEEQDVLHRAMELFWKKGYHATSVQDLVGHLGINRASLYDTFGDKHQLFVSALGYYRGANAGGLLELLANDFPVRDKLRAMLKFAVEDPNKKPEDRGCFIINTVCEMAQDEEVTDFTQDHMKLMVDALESAIRAGQEKGEIEAGPDPRTLAFHFYNSYNGMMVLSKSGADCQALQGIAETALSVLDN